jgi:hypothetical protein
LILVAAATTRAALTAAGWRPPPLSPVVVRPIGVAAAGFAVAVILLAAGVAVAVMRCSLGWRGVLFVSLLVYVTARLKMHHPAVSRNLLQVILRVITREILYSAV